MRSPHRRRSLRAALALLGAALPLAALEGAARLAFPEDPPAALLKAPLDSSVNSHLPELFAPHPRLFWTLRGGLDVDRLPWADRTTRSGLRGTEEPQQLRGRMRVLCVGDSCTYGFGVPYHAAWPARAAAVSRCEVLNAGVPGYSSYQGRMQLEGRTAALQPDALVIQFGINDANAWPSFPAGDAVFLTDTERAQHVRLASWFRRSAFLGWVLTQAAAPRQRRLPADVSNLMLGAPRVPVREFEENLSAMAQRAPRTVLVRWPRRRELDPDWPDPVPSARDAAYAAAVRRVAAGTGVLVDVGEVFRRSGLDASELFVDGVHASAAGNRLVARAVAAALRRPARARLVPGSERTGE